MPEAIIGDTINLCKDSVGRQGHLPVAVSERAFFENPAWLLVIVGFELLKVARRLPAGLTCSPKENGVLEKKMALRDGGNGGATGDGGEREATGRSTAKERCYPQALADPPSG